MLKLGDDGEIERKLTVKTCRERENSEGAE